MRKIGIFSGTFDPVHKGHITFALEAAAVAGLDKVYFLPEAMPRRKEGMTHYAHRVAMLRLAVQPYKRLAVVDDLPDRQFSVNRTLPRLQQRFEDAELYLLLGSDAVSFLDRAEEWPDAKQLLSSLKLIVGIRQGDVAADIVTRLQGMITDRSFHVVMSDNAHVSSSDIRASLGRGVSHQSALSSLDDYISKNWLYATIS